MPVPRRPRVRLQVQHPAALEDLANSLAEREYKRQIKLSPELGRLVKAILSNQSIGKIAEELDRADNRGAIRLSQEGAQLVEEALASVHGAANINRESVASREARGT